MMKGISKLTRSVRADMCGRLSMFAFYSAAQFFNALRFYFFAFRFYPAPG